MGQMEFLRAQLMAESTVVVMMPSPRVRAHARLIDSGEEIFRCRAKLNAIFHRQL